MSTNNTNTPGGNANGRKIFIGAIAVVVIAAAVFFVTRNRDQNANTGNETVTIGAILPLTGKYADAGNGAKVGLEFAIHDISAQGKINYQMVTYDTQSDAKNALTGYSRLKTLNKINIFFTTMGDHSLILKPEAIKSDSLLFCVSALPDITKDNKQLVFRLATTTLGEVNCMLQHISNSLHSKRVFTYMFNNEACLEYGKLIKERDAGNLVGTCLYEEDFAAMRNIVTANTYKNADCIIIIGTTPAMGFLVKLIREGGYSGPIIASAAFNQPSILNAAGEYGKQVSFVDYDFPYHSNQQKIWNDEAQKKYKTSFSIMSYHTYGALRILNRINSPEILSPRDIGKILSENKTYKLNAGDAAMKFNAQDGGITTDLRMRTISEDE